MSRAFKQGQLLSKPSKDRLKEIFINNQNDSCTRKHALAIWNSSPSEGDLPTLQTILSEDEIYDRVLMAKAKYRDLNIVDQLIDKIKNNDSTYWWQATRYMWHDKFEQIFEDHMLTINDDNYWMLFEIFEKFSIEKAENLLEKHWDKLNQYNIFIQLALLVATDKLCSLVHTAIQDRNLQEVFKYFNHHWGFKQKGRKGIERYEQLLAIKPYIQYLDDFAKTELYEISLKNGWKNFAIEFIDPLIPNDCQYCLKISTIRLSEDLQEGRIIWSDRWVHDCIEKGWSISEAFENIISWLDNNYCDLAVDIVASNLEYLGSRQQFLRLNNLCETKGINLKIQEILERTYSAVYLRTIE